MFLPLKIIELVSLARFQCLKTVWETESWNDEADKVIFACTLLHVSPSEIYRLNPFVLILGLPSMEHSEFCLSRFDYAALEQTVDRITAV